QFNLSRNIDAAAQDVQQAISAALPQLPTGMPNPPSLRKSNPSDSPILFLSLNSDVLSLPQVDEYAEPLIAQRISMVDGVSTVQVYGAWRTTEWRAGSMDDAASRWLCSANPEPIRLQSSLRFVR